MIEAINVTALNKYVKTILEKDAVLTDVAIRGEISNFVNHFKTGHFYLSLKDDKCSVKAVMFKTDASRLAFMPENGMNVIVFCRVSLFERDGSFQIYITEMIPDGVGAMQLAFEQLKLRLEKEGLFDEEHKKPLPYLPQKIAVVTSKTGAALQDIINVIQRRYPVAHILLVPVTVQGSSAAEQIASGITKADCGLADVIIVARGGGSKEDLWVFNDEHIARAAYNTNTPIVSAIGHEIDFTILDFVADLRAPTPSAAAEIVTPDFYAILAKNTDIYTNIRRQIQNKMNLCYNSIDKLANCHEFAVVKQMPAKLKQQLIQSNDEVRNIIEFKMQTYRKSVSHCAAMVEELSPLKIMARGYSIAQNHCGNIKSVKSVNVNDNINIVLQDGKLSCIITDILEDKNANI